MNHNPSSSGDKTVPILSVLFPFVFLAFAALILCSGCALARVPTPCGNAYVGSLFKSPEIPKVEMKSVSGDTWKLEGYKGAVEAATIGEIAGAAAKAMVKP